MGGQPALVDEIVLHVGCDLQHRRGREIGFSQRSHRIGGAGAGAGKQHAGFTGGPGIAIRHVPATQFEPAADEPDLVLVIEQCVKQVQGVN